MGAPGVGKSHLAIAIGVDSTLMAKIKKAIAEQRI